MLKHTLYVVFALVLGATALQAQWTKGMIYVTPHVGVVQYDQQLMFGIDGEYAYSKYGKYGPGAIGIAFSSDYYQNVKNDNSGNLVNKGNYLCLALAGQYHIPIEDTPEFDIFFGAGLYNNILLSATNASGNEATIQSDIDGFGFHGAVGMNYFFSPSVALRAKASLGGGPLASVGISFGF